MTNIDQTLMRRAVELAENSLYLSDPNPRVGCVIARDGNILAEGWTQPVGQAHAEIHALSFLGGKANGADVFVTLEPCSHTGRTGPCTDALIRAGVRRVIAAMVDPNPLVAGRGIAQLREAGIEVEVGLCEAQARVINRGFLRRVSGGRPWVRLKLAATMDGRTATAKGVSKWITGAPAREDVQRWRARSSAVVTGIGTVLADDPSMNVRLAQCARQPLRVVLDSQGRIAPDARILNVPGPTLVVSVDKNATGVSDNLILPGAEKRVNLESLLVELGARQCNEVFVEAGPTLSGAFARQELVDEYIFYIAPSLLGHSAHGMFDLGGCIGLDDMPRLEFTDVERVGDDLRILARAIPKRDS